MPSNTPPPAPTASTKRPASQSPDATPPKPKVASKQTPPRAQTPTPSGPTAAGKGRSPPAGSGAPAGTTTPKRPSPAAPSTPKNSTRVVPSAVSPPKFGGPLKPASAVPGSLIPNLIITAKEEGQEAVIKTTSNQRYPILEEIIHKALKVMETDAGIQRLGSVATTLINRRNEKNQGHTWGSRPMSQEAMSKEMKVFVQKLRANFPPIHLRPMSEDAWTERWVWPADRDVAEVPVPDLAQFNPSECLSLELNTKIISNLMKAKEEQAKGTQGMDDMIQRFHFHLMITVCHEIIHMLVCALSGSGRPATPDNMKVPGNSKAESGWWWEIEAFDGVVAMFFDKTENVLKERQAGIPMLANGTHEKSLVKDISKAFITEFVKISPSLTHTSIQEAGFSHFPIVTTASTTTETFEQAKKRHGNRMGAVTSKTRAVLNPSKKNSPEPKKPAKTETPPTRTSNRTKPGASSAARDSSPSPAPKPKPATKLPIVGGRSGA